jgi:hypothetical protein
VSLNHDPTSHFIVMDIETGEALTEPQRKALEIDEEALASDPQAEARRLGVKPGNTKDPEKLRPKILEAVAKRIERAALHPETGFVAIVGIGLPRDGGWKIITPSARASTIEGKTAEECLLLTVDEILAAEPPGRLVTMNGRGFDMPFLAARCARHGMSLRRPWPVGNDRDHLDLMYHLWGNRTEGHGLNAVMTGILGMQPKTTTGAETAEAIRLGDWDAAEEHCRVDVEATCEYLDRLSRVVRL